MSRKGDSRGRRGGRGAKRGRAKRALIDAVAMGTFLGAVRRGARLEDAAAGAGFTLDGFYGARRRNADFRAAWAEALEASAGAIRLVPNGRRPLQLRKMRNVRFTEARQQAFLDHFAGSADATAAAAAAGVHETTVYKHIRRDPAFASAWNEALAQSFPLLEAEAVRQCLAAQARMRERTLPSGEVAVEFDRVMKLLQRWDRKEGGIGRRWIAHGRQRSWTFEEAIAALDKKLRALGLRRARPPPPPPPEEGDGEGE